MPLTNDFGVAYPFRKVVGYKIKIMKKNILILFVITTSLFGQNSFNKGVNLTNWFQKNSPGEINFKKYTKTDFQNIKSLGCDVIRLPINLHAMADSTNGYELDPLFLSFLDSAVDWAEELNLNLILDNHTFDPHIDTTPDVEKVLIPVWQNMARHYKDRTNLIYYEVLNEPHGISYDIWNVIQQKAINAIRENDTVHTIIVGSSDWTGYEWLKYLPEYEDTNLLYTFHFYDSYLFTHQGADWVTPPLGNLAGIPFPYSASAMPTLPAEYLGTWIEYAYNNYDKDGNESKIRELIQNAIDFRNERNIQIFCGEFGVFKPNSDNEDRVRWYETVRKIFEENNIPWTTWDYQDGFGLFEKDSYELFDHDLNIPLLEALGFNTVPQTEFVNEVELGPFYIYDDYIGNRINNDSWITNNTVLNFYSSTEPANGEHSIYWTDAELYNYISFDFLPDKNFQYIEDGKNQLEISFWIKGDTPNTKIDIRFLDTKTDESEDHPWRMRYTIDDTFGNGSLKWDNTWQQITIPFSEFEEQGSWDNEIWYEPIGKFDWSVVDLFQIVAEHSDLHGHKIWIDDIVIKSTILSVNDNSEMPTEFELKQNYPNPFNPTTTIKYSIPTNVSSESSIVSLKVYDILGKEVATLVNKAQKAGNYEVSFDASNLTSGIYFYKLKAGNFVESKKMILIK